MHPTIVELAQGSETAADFEAGVLEFLQRQVGCDVGFFMVKGEEASTSVLGLDQVTSQRAVSNETYAGELMPVKRAALSARGVAVDTEVLGHAGVRNTSYYRELVGPVGGRHTLLGCLPWGGRTAGAVMLGRAGGAFSARAVDHVAALLPQLGVARAAFGLPWTSEPLRTEATPNLLERLGLGERARVVASVPTPSATISVRDRGAYREMVASSGGSEFVWTRAALADPAQSGWPYIDLFHVAAATARRRRRALFIGCGGAVALRQFASVYPGIALDLIESEPAVIELARAHYGLGSIPRLRVHISDGVDFLRHAPAERWDIGIVDAFDAAGVASPFTRRPFFAALRRILRSGGTAACNFIASLDRQGLLPRIVGAAGKELEDVRVVPVIVPGEDYAPDAQRNVVIIGRRG